MIILTNLLFLIAVDCLMLIRTSYCDPSRAHKVHNIVLYPDRSSWCNATRIIQIINHTGCKSVKIDNNVCVGTCFSYVVPRTIPSSPGYVRPYCDSCRPLDTVWKEVTLECEEGEYKGKNITKYMEVIENCSCQTCPERSQQDLYTETGEEIIDTENNLIEDSQAGLLEGYENMFNTNFTTNSTVKMMNKNKDPEQDEFWNFLKKLERSNDKIDFGKLMQIKKKIEEDLNIQPKIRHIQESLSKSKHGCKELEGQGPHHSSVLSKDCYETYPSGMYPNSHSNPKLNIDLIEKETAAPLILDGASSLQNFQSAINGLNEGRQTNVEFIDQQGNSSDHRTNFTNVAGSTTNKSTNINNDGSYNVTTININENANSDNSNIDNNNNNNNNN